MSVPAILSKEEFDEVGALMRARASQLKAPRFVSGPTLLGGVAHCADCGGAMTVRTSGKSYEYRYYTCCTKARQGETGCKGRTVPQGMLDDLVVTQLEKRLLNRERLTEILSGLLDRRRASDAGQQERVIALKKQAAEADAKLTRLYGAIEDGVADPKDENLKGRLAELRMIRDSARADVERAEGRVKASEIEITPELLGSFAVETKRRLRREDGGYRRHQIQALAERVEVGDREIRISGSTSSLVKALVASGSSVNSDTNCVRSFDPKWLPELDSNQRPLD